MRPVKSSGAKWFEAGVLVICVCLFALDIAGPRALGLELENRFSLPEGVGSFFNYASAGSVVVAVILMLYKDLLVRRLNREKAAGRVKAVAVLFYWVVVAGIILHIASLGIRLGYLYRMQDVRVSDVFGSHCIDALSRILLFVYLLISDRQTIKYLVRTKASTLVAHYYVGEWDKSLKEEGKEEETQDTREQEAGVRSQE